MVRTYKAFTLIEMILALTVFSLFVVGIVLAVNNGYRYVENAKLQTMSINLAREGVEMVYTLRDTNRRRHSGEKDKYWLMANPFDTNTSARTLFVGNYSLEMGLSEGRTGQSYPLLRRNEGGCPSDIYENFPAYFGNSSCSDQFKIQFTGTVLSGSESIAISTLMENEAIFYRVVRVIGLYDKTVGKSANDAIDCRIISDCNNANPKELRFCVKVYAVGTHVVFSELCSMMTNFRV